MVVLHKKPGFIVIITQPQPSTNVCKPKKYVVPGSVSSNFLKQDLVLGLMHASQNQVLFQKKIPSKREIEKLCNGDRSNFAVQPRLI